MKLTQKKSDCFKNKNLTLTERDSRISATRLVKIYIKKN